MDELMAESMALVPKMIRILEARGMPVNKETLDFGPVEDALGCPLPQDFKAISQATHKSVYCWALCVENFHSPKEILEDRTSLDLDWSSKDKDSFVPIARNSSAFYYGYVKDKTLQKCTKLMCIDGEEGNFDVASNQGRSTELPLGILMYRFVVRAVTAEIWDVYGKNMVAAEFWTSESEAEDRGEHESRSARDGSQDHAASEDGIRIVVLGRPVCYLQQYDDDEEDEDLETASVFQGASEEDFMGVGVYGITHPMDQEEEDRQRARDEAPKAVATISTQHLNKENLKLANLGFDPPISTGLDPEFENQIVKATILKQRLAVERNAAAVIGDNGRMALLNALDGRLWWNSRMNGLLDSPEESFTQVALGEGSFGYALTSKNRLLKWNTMELDDMGNPTEFKWVTIPDSISSISQLDMRQGGIKLVLSDGGLATVEGDTVEIIPDVENLVSVSGNLKLYADGTVSKSDERVECRAKIVAIQDCGRHELLLATDGCVYGLGSPSQGVLPLAVTPERIADYEASQERFKKQVEEVEMRLGVFDKEMETHCQTCPKAVPPPTKKPRFPMKKDENPMQKIMFRIQCACYVHGVHHTPEACGAPSLPDDIRQGLDVPLPCETNFGPPEEHYAPHEWTKARLLTVGPEHGRIMDISAPLTPKNSWNSVKGPYGLPCASTEPAISLGGSYNSSIFLHQDGKLSGCGESSDLTLGLKPPKVEESDDEEDVMHDEGRENIPKVPVISRHLYSQSAGHCYIPVIGKIGMPAAAILADETRIVAAESGSDGSLAVDSEGRVWGCGDNVGRNEPGGTYELLYVLGSQSDDL